MPRIANIYSIPPGTEGFPDQTIESEKYNNYIHDVETDLNLPRPISAGGTGATTADGALASLHAEKAGQEVLNFDSHVWMAGSFFSKTTATAPPVAGHAFSGIVHITDVDNMVVHAVDLTGAFKTPWMRVKTAGVWGAWIQGSAYAPLVCSDTPPADAADNELWFESDTGLLYVRYNDGDSTQWCIACPQPDISSYVLKDGDTMEGPLILPADLPTLDLQAVTKKYVDDRAVVEASAFDGLQINGSFDVSQESGITPRGTTGYICDGWVLTKILGGTGVVSFKQSPSPGVFPNAMSNMLLGNVTTVQSTLAATDVVSVTTRIEGYRVARLGWGGTGAQPITIGFWTGHSPAGKYSVSIHNRTDERSYVTSYEQVTANVLQYNTITIPGDGPGPGTWAIANEVGLSIIFTMAAGIGSLQTSSTEQWLTGNAIAATGQINGLTATPNSFKLAQVIVLPGVAVPSSARSGLIMRPYDQELQSCKRYYQKFSNFMVDTSAVYPTFVFPVEMRAVPVISGGGAGFLVLGATIASANLSQNTRASQTIVLDARL